MDKKLKIGMGIAVVVSLLTVVLVSIYDQQTLDESEIHSGVITEKYDQRTPQPIGKGYNANTTYYITVNNENYAISESTYKQVETGMTVEYQLAHSQRIGNIRIVDDNESTTE